LKTPLVVEHKSNLKMKMMGHEPHLGNKSSLLCLHTSKNHYNLQFWMFHPHSQIHYYQSLSTNPSFHLTMPLSLLRYHKWNLRLLLK
jgi:hypothetical protein